MTSRGKAFLLALAATGLATAAGARPAQEKPPPPTPGPTPAAKMTEAPKCADCHADQVKAFLANPHARSARHEQSPDPESFCATCHGDGTKHMESGGDASLIHGFHGVAGAEDCRSCHEKTNEHESFATGFHANSATVNCLTCHSIHKSPAKSEHLLANAPGALCQTCHEGTSASLRNKPFAHRLDRGGMTCVSCHDPHGRRERLVRLTRDGELACVGCHAEKRGPFVFDHVTGSAGDCLSCHQPHGSNNPKMLNWARVDQLCLSCHSQTGTRTAGGQPPSFHDLTLPRYRNCTTCHVMIHGSNQSEFFFK